MLNVKTPSTCFLLFFNKISINSNYQNINYFLINFFNLNLYNLNFFFKYLFIINSKKINFNNIKNRNFFFKNFNNFRKHIFFKKFIFKFIFKYNKFFTFLYLNKIKSNNKFNNFFILQNNKFKSFYFYNYKNNFFKNWNFLIGFLISPYFADLYPRRIWTRKKLFFNLSPNRLYFNLFSKKKLLHNKSKLKNLKVLKSNFRKFFLNNYFYIKYSNDNKFLKYFLKFNNEYPANSPLLRKKNYDWFLSKPYLFLNTTRFFKSNKNYLNFYIFFLFKKYLRFFNTIKKLNFGYKYKNTGDLFFKKIFFNINLINKNYKNKINLNRKLIKNKFSIYLNKNQNTFKKKKNNFKKNIKYASIFFLLLKSKILKKIKFYFNFKFFFKTKLKFIKFSRRIKKINIFVKSFFLFKKLKQQAHTLFKNNKVIFKYLNKLFNYEKTFLFFKTFKKNTILFFLSANNFLISFVFNKKFFINTNFNQIYRVNYNKSWTRSNVFLKLKKPIYATKLKNNFILNQYGFFFINNFFLNYRNNLQYVYNLKKLMYSFSYKNEIQKFILRRYVKIFSVSNHFYKNFFFNNEINNPLQPYFQETSSNLILDKFFFKNSNATFLFTKRLTSLTSWTYFKNQILSAKVNHKDISDFNIKRVKFKPGYMNLWRDARLVVKNSLFLKMRYQHKLTNYLSKYNKFLYFKISVSLEMRLANIILKSRLFSDWALSLLFLENNNIYVNGFICSNPNFQIFVGDFIQTMVTHKYYVLSRWFFNLNLKKKNKLKKVIRKKSFHPSNSDEKKKSYNLPKWVLFNKNLIEDSANFIEIDYFTLSILILYEPFLWSDINPYNIIDQKFNIINLYNWKYIT